MYYLIYVGAVVYNRILFKCCKYRVSMFNSNEAFFLQHKNNTLVNTQFNILYELHLTF